MLEKLFKAMKTVPPTSIKQLSIVNSFVVTFEFLPLSKIIKNYRKLRQKLSLSNKKSVIELSSLKLNTFPNFETIFCSSELFFLLFRA
jgi:hypothetical protein